LAKVNPVKLKQDAEKEERAGRLDKALPLYRQLVEVNPKDWNTVKKIGDLYAKLNRTREATQEYAKVADFYTRDGFLLKAIAVWKQVVRLDASALDPYLKLADLYAKQGLLMEAKSQYQIVVDEYLKKGKSRDAGDVLRKMVEIEPTDLKLQTRLADLYIREGRKDKAIEVYIAIADQLNQKGHLAESVQVLQKGLKMDATSSRLRLELARIHLLQKNFDKATSFLEEARHHAPNDPAVLGQLGEAYLGSKRISEAEEIYRRLVQINPDDKESRTRMGRLYLAKGDLDAAFDEFSPVVEAHLEREEAGSAITLVQEVLARDPDHVKSLVKLVEIYRIQKNDAAVVQAYSNLSDAYIKLRQFDQASSVLDILVSMEPQNQQHRSKLDMVRQKLGSAGAAPQPAPAPSPGFEAPAPEPLEDFSLDLEPAEPSFEPGPAPAPAAAPASASAGARGAPERPSIELSGSLSDEDQEFIDEHLAEGRVFRKYGLVDKAAEQFQAVVARFADHIETREELCDVFKEKGDAKAAAEQYLALAEIHRLHGDDARARTCEDEARGLSPDSVPAAPGPAPMAVPAPAVAAPAPEPELEPFPEPEPEPEPIPLSVEAADEEIPIGLDESPEEFPLDLEEPGEDLQIGGSAGDDDDDLMSGFGGPAEEEEFSLDLPVAEAPAPLAAAPAPLQAAAPAPAARSGVPAELQKALADVEQYMSLGFVDDAKEALRQIQARHPDHPAIQQKVAELGLEEGSELGGLDDLGLGEPPPLSIGSPSEPSLLDDLGEAPSVPAIPVVADPPVFEGEGMIDLGAELGDILGAQSAVEEEEPAGEVSAELGDLGLTEIFNEFRRGVDKQLGQEDYDTRYNLGIAYKEMGLVDEAISEFQLAAKDPGRIFECSSMLGICFIEKGMPKIAVNWFQKALQAGGRSAEEYAGLRYDLASAYEAAGELDEAVSLLTDLYAENSGFRDVATRLRELKAASR